VNGRRIALADATQLDEAVHETSEGGVDFSEIAFSTYQRAENPRGGLWEAFTCVAISYGLFVMYRGKIA
jgi:hypothetical protein